MVKPIILPSMQICVSVSVSVKVAQSCLILCDPMAYRVHGILQARILEEWVAFPFSGVSSQPRNRTRVSCIAGGFFTNRAIREAPCRSVPLKFSRPYWQTPLSCNYFSRDAEVIVIVNSQAIILDMNPDSKLLNTLCNFPRLSVSQFSHL